MKEITLNVKGMSCNHCKMAVEGELKALDGVEDAVVSLENNNVTVNYDDTKVDVDKLKEAIEEAGYETGD
jgi:copper chaperone